MRFLLSLLLVAFSVPAFAAAPCPRCKQATKQAATVQVQVVAVVQTPAEGLIQAGRRYPGARVCESQQHPALMAAAQRHAEYQARVRRLGHQGFGNRVAELQGTAGAGSYAEICAQSWVWQAKETSFKLGWEMFWCWQRSPGHWSVASRKHHLFGAGMAKGADNIWYSCIIVKE